MASLSINVPDAVVPRIRAAFTVTEHANGVPAERQMTVPEIEQWIKEKVKEKVRQHEAAVVARAKETEVGREQW